MMADFNKVGVLFIRGGSLLLCRKRDLSKLIMPGGQVEPGETDEQCLERECREELGDAISVSRIQYLGTYEDIAASDDPAVRKTVQIRLYQAELQGTPVASAEIKELLWFNRGSDRRELSPIIVNKILPDLLDRGLLAWSSEP